MQSILKYFASYIESQLGIVYVEANFYQLEHRLNDITTQLGFKDIQELYSKAQSGIDGQMKSLILDLATNNETSFFRDIAVFRALREHIIPEILKSGFKHSVDIWSAASSSGQEVYSIAMEYDLAKKENPKIPAMKMLASDVSDIILNRAKLGRYSQLEVQRGLPAKNLITYFEKDETDQWNVKSNLKNNIDFKKINLLHEWGNIGPFDIVFCRNVLIYQNVENKKKVIEGIHKKLNPGGFLVLGAAESLFGLSTDFNQISASGSIVYQKK